MIIGGYSDETDLTKVAEDRTWYVNILENNLDCQWTAGPAIDKYYTRAFHQCGVVLLDKDNGQTSSVLLITGGEESRVDPPQQETLLSLILDEDEKKRVWNYEDRLGLCRRQRAAASIVTPDRRAMLIIGGSVEDLNPVYNQPIEGICSCKAKILGITCSLMQQKLKFPRAFGIAMLIPNSFTTCQE